jgi:hypothetical protein
MLVDKVIEVFLKNCEYPTMHRHFDHSMIWFVSEKEIKDVTPNHVYIKDAGVWLYKLSRKAFKKKEILLINGAEQIPEDVLYN